MNRKTRTQPLALVAALGLTAIAGPAGAAGRAAEPANDALAFQKSFVALWNEERFDEIHDFFAADAIAAPPNHDLLRGNAAITAFYRTSRPLLGELLGGQEPHAVVRSGNVTTVMGNYVFATGVRLTSIEVYERAADGRYKCTLDQFGFRDPLT